MKTFEFVTLCRTPFLKRILGYPALYQRIETMLADGSRTVVATRIAYL